MDCYASYTCVFKMKVDYAFERGKCAEECVLFRRRGVLNAVFIPPAYFYPVITPFF